MDVSPPPRRRRGPAPHTHTATGEVETLHLIGGLVSPRLGPPPDLNTREVRLAISALLHAAARDIAEGRGVGRDVRLGLLRLADALRLTLDPHQPSRPH